MSTTTTGAPATTAGATPDLLTRRQVARLTGLHPDTIPTWAACHRIRPTPTSRGDAYPAVLTRWAAAYDRRMAAAVERRHRLARFIRNPLNH